MAVAKNISKKAVGKEKTVKNEPAGLGSGINPPQPSLKGGSSPSSLEPVLNSIQEGVRGDLHLPLYNQDGEEVGKMNLPEEIFGLSVKSEVVRQAVQAQLTNTRINIAHAKDRSEVRGGGKKPWRQKGTGRSRHSSIRSPLWSGGGVTFGPRSEKNFARKINKKMKRQALLMVLSGKAKDNEIVLIDDLKLSQAKTKVMAEIINKVAKGAKQNLLKSALIVLSQNDQAVVRAAKNIPKIKTIGAKSLNIMDLMSAKYLLMPKAAIEVIKETYGFAK